MPQPAAMMVSKDHAATRAMLIWMAFKLVQGHHVILAWPIAMGHVCICGPIGARVWDDVHGSCYHKGSKELCVLKSEGHAEPGQYFTGPEIAFPILD